MIIVSKISCQKGAGPAGRDRRNRGLQEADLIIVAVTTNYDSVRNFFAIYIILDSLKFEDNRKTSIPGSKSMYSPQFLVNLSGFLQSVT